MSGPEQRGLGAALAWACFLGSSWTWIIGMFFPVLLLRDYGLWGWIVFAVPNVLGAAVFGYVISSRAVSERVLFEHTAAAVRFSDFTIAFHVFVVGWVYVHLFGLEGAMAAGIAAVVVWMLAMRGTALALTAAVVVSVVSLALLIAWVGSGEGGLAGAGEPVRLSRFDLLMFAPAALLGFALCPYLDLTFHRARQATSPTTGKAAFTLGFCGVFFAMIVFTLLYAPLLRPVIEDGQVVLSGRAMWILGIHMTLQAGFTAALHVNEVGSRRGHAGIHRVAAMSIAAGALAYWALTDPEWRVGELGAGEVVYRGFVLLYGVAFPAYVWLCMLPTRKLVSPRARQGVFAVTLLVTLPMAYLSFISGPSWWILPILVIFAMAWAAVESLPPVVVTGSAGQGEEE